jgi:hypothetical protein
LPDDAESTKLVDSHYFTLVVRLLVAKQGELRRGILVALDEQPVGSFRRLDEIPGLIRAWLSSKASTADPASDGHNPYKYD